MSQFYYSHQSSFFIQGHDICSGNCHEILAFDVEDNPCPKRKAIVVLREVWGWEGPLEMNVFYCKHLQNTPRYLFC